MSVTFSRLNRCTDLVEFRYKNRVPPGEGYKFSWDERRTRVWSRGQKLVFNYLQTINISFTKPDNIKKKDNDLNYFSPC